jgi:hypothetical protein
VLDGDFYAAMHLQAARERDNRAALAAAARRIVQADATYVTVDVVRHADAAYRLRAVRRLERVDADANADAVQLQLGAG